MAKADSGAIVPGRVYTRLFAATYLPRAEIEIPDLAELIYFLTWEEPSKKHPGRRFVKVGTLDRKIQWRLKDAVEKFGFALLAMNSWREAQKLPRDSGIYATYHFYNFIIYCKATLDSIAVTLNEYFKWGIKGGDIDFGKTKFSRQAKSLALFKFSPAEREWVSMIIEYRNDIVHRKSVDLSSDTILLHPASYIEVFELWVAQSGLKQPANEKLLTIDLNGFLDESVRMLTFFVSAMAKELLDDLKLRFPEHESSRTSLREGNVWFTLE